MGFNSGFKGLKLRDLFECNCNVHWPLNLLLLEESKSVCVIPAPPLMRGNVISQKVICICHHKGRSKIFRSSGQDIHPISRVIISQTELYLRRIIHTRSLLTALCCVLREDH